jgi:hypothetical protein
MMFAQCRLFGLLLVASRYWLTFPGTRGVPIDAGIHALAADFDSLATLLENTGAGLASQRAKAHCLLLLGPDAKPAVPVVRRILQQGPRDPRVTELFQSFLRKAAE